MLKEVYVEHDAAMVMINQIETGSPDEEFFDAKIKVIPKEIEHSLRQEEQCAESMLAQDQRRASIWTNRPIACASVNLRL